MRFSVFQKISAAAIMAVMAALLVAEPVAAQFSNHYNYLRGVRNRNFEEVSEIIEQPSGAAIINARERATGLGALHIVTRDRDTQWLLYLLRHEADPNIRDNDGNTPLHIAAQIDFAEAVRWLLVVQGDANARNSRGETPLILAVQHRNADIVRQLIDAGANPAVADSVIGLSARDYAVRDGRSQNIIEILDSAEPVAEQAPVVGPTP
jgi:hypothetical protein